MKPRLRIRFGIWTCRASYIGFGGRVPVIGNGYTPKEAYDDWKAQWPAVLAGGAA